MFERPAGLLLVAGIGFFALAFLSNGLLPVLMYRQLPEKSVRDVVNGQVRYQFEDLAMRYPQAFTAAFGQPPADESAAHEWFQQRCAEALALGRQVYIGEGCWHCHSQFVRPVSNEERRWGPVSQSWEYQNRLQRPVMFGTRRVGPDLSREGGRRSNDWHAVHFFRPTWLSPESPMPAYPWLFEGSPDRPNRRGLALITYVQWLGSWLESYPFYESYQPITISSEEAEG
ncbi:MAG: hypothetical protein KatS3mg114_1421 [Planctomycetaceae bacterium]|nr:MAG: hypothetical protein KatS3mg114_1421 [Planctomycetaceae bacterium]